MCGHGYGPETVCLFLRLVLEAGVSLRGVPRVLAAINKTLGLGLLRPHWTTGRQWLLRLGHAMLAAQKVVADDWAWLIDHSVQIGKDKCLVILGIRLCDLPPGGQSLRQEDMELIALLPAQSWTQVQVYDALEKAVQDTGQPPRVIVSDHGVDISGGIALFQQRYPQTVEIYDTKHKAACLLKARLGKNPRWQEFQTSLGQTRCAVQQTELACLTPPAPKPKARFMNLAGQLAWGQGVLAVLRQPESLSPSVRPERLRQKLGWTESFAAELGQWSQWQQVVDVAVGLVNGRGIYRGRGRRVGQRVRATRGLGRQRQKIVR